MSLLLSISSNSLFFSHFHCLQFNFSSSSFYFLEFTLFLSISLPFLREFPKSKIINYTLFFRNSLFFIFHFHCLQFNFSSSSFYFLEFTLFLSISLPSLREFPKSKIINYTLFYRKTSKKKKGKKKHKKKHLAVTNPNGN